MFLTDAIEGGSTARYLVIVVALLLLTFGVAAIARAATKKEERTRHDVQRALATTEQALARMPDDPNTREQLARLLFESGEFWRAAALIEPAAKRVEATPAEILLAAELEYLLGRYADAEGLYRKLLAHAGADKSSRSKATIGLGFVYYQTNRFDRFRELDFAPGVEFPADKVIRSFESPPYQVKWRGDERVCEVPFVVTDPLPVMAIEYNGRPVHVLFDTGADMCVLDSELADQWGIKSQSWTIGAFGGGKLGRIGYGKLDSIKVGSVTLDDVPILIMPTQRFSSIFAQGKQPIGGIIGTGLIRQFLATLDYEHQKLVLRERSPQAQRALRTELDGHIVAEVPFVLTATHWMMARGSLDGRDGLTFFVDSGLAADAAFAAPTQTLRLAGIAVPDKKTDPRSVGGGGGAWASAPFPIQSLGLGSLRQQQLKGEYGSMADSTYWQNGFIQDGLISHGFLRKYASWTIDFDEMKYLFARSAAR